MVSGRLARLPWRTSHSFDVFAMHLIAKQLCAGVLIGACVFGAAQAADAAKPNASFPAFIAKFRAAISAGDRAGVAALSRLPLRDDGKPMTAADAAEYVAPFFGPLRKCVLKAKPEADGAEYFIFCGEQGLGFAPVNGEYRFTEYFAND